MLSSIVLFGNGAKAKKQKTILGSYLDIHPDWKAFMERCEPRVDGKPKETSAKVAQMENTEKNIPAERNAPANTQLRDVAECASVVADKEIAIHSPSKVNDIQTRCQSDAVALCNDGKFHPEENDKGVQVACKEAGRGNSCETKFTTLEATEPSPEAHAASPDDADVMRFPLGQGWAKVWYPDNTNTDQKATEPSPGAHAASPDDADVMRFPLGQGWAKFWYPDNTNTDQKATEPSPGAHAASPDDADVMRFPLGQGWAKFWYPDNTNTNARKADVQSAPSALARPRTGLCRAFDQQRRTAQSAQPDPLPGMERYNLVVVEKDFSITIQEAGLRPRDLQTTEVAREAAATNTKPPRPRARKVTFNLNAAPQSEGRLRRGWARVSAAAQRMFQRCRCCLGQR